MREIGEVCKISRSSVSADDISDGTYYVGLEHIDGNGNVKGVHIAEGELNSNKFKFKDGDILYGKLRPYLRKIAIAECEGICSTDIIPVRVGNKANAKYIKYLLRSEQLVRYANSRTSGANLPRISPKEIAKLKIPLPPLPVQRRIAAALDLADRQRQLLRAEIAAYGELGESLFLEMFGDPVTNPKGWNTVSLGGQLDFLTSGSRGWAKHYSTEGDLFLRIQNVGYDDLRLADLQKVQAPKSQEAIRTTVQKGDIVLSITADLGRTAVIPNNLPKAYINQHLALLRLNKLQSPKFVSSYIASKGGQTLFKRLDKGGVKAGLNFTDIKSYKLYDVPLAKQMEYVRRIQKIEALKAQAETALAEADDLFNALLQRAFRGELFKERVADRV